MTNLNFSEPIVLSSNQVMSVVIDDLKGTDGSPMIANYGLVPVGSDATDGEVFNLKVVIKDLNEQRKFDILQAKQGGKPKDAKDELLISCAEQLKNKVKFTVKSFPHYGVYGYVNYNNGEDSSLQRKIILDVAREGGDIF